MALEGPASPISVLLRIDMQHHPRNLSPVGALLIGIEYAEIGDHMFLVVCGQ